VARANWPRNAIKSFGEGYAPTAPIQTSEPSDSHIENHPSRLYRQILNPTMAGAVDARRRSPPPRTPGRTNRHSLERPLAPTMRRTPNANIRAERPVDLGLHDLFLPVMGDIEQLRAPKLRKALFFRRCIALYFKRPHTQCGIVVACLSKSCPKIGTIPEARLFPLAALVPSAGTKIFQIELYAVRHAHPCADPSARLLTKGGKPCKFPRN
jgi:hypothetical protein